MKTSEIHRKHVFHSFPSVFRTMEQPEVLLRIIDLICQIWKSHSVKLLCDSYFLSRFEQETNWPDGNDRRPMMGPAAVPLGTMALSPSPVRTRRAFDLGGVVEW